MESVRARCVSACLPDPRVCALRSNYLLYVGLVVSAESPSDVGLARRFQRAPHARAQPGPGSGLLLMDPHAGDRPGRWGSGRTRTRLSPSHALEGRASLQASRQGVLYLRSFRI